MCINFINDLPKTGENNYDYYFMEGLTRTQSIKAFHTVIVIALNKSLVFLMLEHQHVKMLVD